MAGRRLADPAADEAQSRRPGAAEPLRVDQHQGRRDLRLLRLQRIVRRRGGPAQVQAGPRRLHQAHARARNTTASRRRGWCCFRRSPTRTCGDPNLPDGQANNERLKLYTAAMAEVAKANDVPFVDLFTPTLQLYQGEQAPDHQRRASERARRSTSSQRSSTSRLFGECTAGQTRCGRA